MHHFMNSIYSADSCPCSHYLTLFFFIQLLLTFQSLLQLVFLQWDFKDSQKNSRNRFESVNFKPPNPTNSFFCDFKILKKSIITIEKLLYYLAHRAVSVLLSSVCWAVWQRSKLLPSLAAVSEIRRLWLSLRHPRPLSLAPFYFYLWN